MSTLRQGVRHCRSSYLGRHQELLAEGVAIRAFREQILRPLFGVVLYAGAAVVGWFVHPTWSVAIFVAMILFHGWTSQGVGSLGHDEPNSA